MRAQDGPGIYHLSRACQSMAQELAVLLVSGLHAQRRSNPAHNTLVQLVRGVHAHTRSGAAGEHTDAAGEWHIGTHALVQQMSQQECANTHPSGNDAL